MDRQSVDIKPPVAPAFSADQPTPPHHPTMNLPPSSNGLIAPHTAPHIQPTLPPQQPGLSDLDVSQPTRDTHLNNTYNSGPSNNIDPFSIFTSNVPRSFVQNVNPPSQPPLVNDPLSSLNLWPLFIPPPPDRSSHHSSTTQNGQATSACHTCPTHPTSGPFQFGGERPAPAVHNPTALSAAAPSSSSSFPNPTAPHTAPPIPEEPLFRPGAADVGPSTAFTHARRRRRVRPRPPREVPLVRIEDRIEWVSRDVMKMTLWFNWSPDAEDEAHEAWD